MGFIENPNSAPTVGMIVASQSADPVFTSIVIPDCLYRIQSTNLSFPGIVRWFPPNRNCTYPCFCVITAAYVHSANSPNPRFLFPSSIVAAPSGLGLFSHFQVPPKYSLSFPSFHLRYECPHSLTHLFPALFSRCLWGIMNRCSISILFFHFCQWLSSFGIPFAVFSFGIIYSFGILSLRSLPFESDLRPVLPLAVPFSHSLVLLLWYLLLF